MGPRLTWKALGSLAAMAILFAVLVASLYLLATTAVRLDRFGRYYHWLLLVNGFALALLAGLIFVNGWRLLKEFRGRVAGSRLTLRMVIMSIILALVPVTLVYSFSVKFLNSNIDSWYDIEIEQALDDALELSRESLGLQMRTLQKVTIDVAEQLVGVSDSAAVVALNSFSVNTEASEMTLMGPDKRIIASTGLSSRISVQPNRPDDDLAARARRGLSYVGVDPIGDGELYIRVVTPVFSDDPTAENSVLQALFPIASRSNDLAESVQSSYQSYRQLVFLRKPLKRSSILTLSLALLMSVMMGVWFALYASRRMMMPIHDLVEGTRAVAQGDYNTRIYKRGQDELGFLVQSFNFMTLQLDRSRKSAEVSQQEIESQRTYLEAVLRQISSGVITLDADMLVRTSNTAAQSILESDLSVLERKPLQDSVQQGGVLGQFAEQISEQITQKPGTDWTAEIEVYGHEGKRVLLCRAAVLSDAQDQFAGTVIAIDDMTAIISAQRDAAWAEVARRLAHEIKNPLTPIRLSAERLRHKVLGKLEGADAAVLERLTLTIENQVDAMKAMVNAFSEYASTPNLDLQQTDINDLLEEVVMLYEDNVYSADIKLDLSEKLPQIPADAPRMRQLLHNLIKNSLEAQQDNERKVLCIRTRKVQVKRTALLEIVTEDAGPGFPVELINRLFEPYVTSKPRGTGLGLAIVKKIVEEHGGTVVAENIRSARNGTHDGSQSAAAKDVAERLSGARVIVRLPVLSNVVQLSGDAA